MCVFICMCVGVPPGVVNVVFGTGPHAGDALVGHPDVPLVSFTGSTATARVITERGAPYCKKLSLELGGKNPALVFADADMEQCIATTVRSSFSNQVRLTPHLSQSVRKRLTQEKSSPRSGSVPAQFRPSSGPVLTQFCTISGPDPVPELASIKAFWLLLPGVSDRPSTLF